MKLIVSTSAIQNTSKTIVEKLTTNEETKAFLSYLKPYLSGKAAVT
jgi:hypothetical protein